jgi:hypothetical protein
MVAVAMPMRMIMVVVVRHLGCKGEQISEINLHY